MTGQTWSPALTSIGIALAHSVWQVGAIATLLAVVLRLLRNRKPQLRYLACLTAMGAVTAAFVTTLLIARATRPDRFADFGPVAVLNAASGESRSVSAVDQGSTELEAAHSVGVFVETADFEEVSAESSGYSEPAIEETAPDRSEASVEAVQHAAAPAVSVEQRASSEIDTSGTLAWALPVSALIWSAGVVLLAGRLAAGHLGLRRIRGACAAPADWIRELAVRLQHRMGVSEAVRVGVSERVSAPMAFGLVRPVIILPVSVGSGCSPELAEAVLAHELAHILRRDLWVNLFQRIVETLLFYHPAMWWISGRMRLERELCCDALAVQATGRREEYARTLVTLSAGAGASAALGLAMLGPRISLSNRVRRVLGLPAVGHYGHSWLAGPLTVMAAMAMFIAAQARTDTASAAPASEAKPQGETDAAAFPAVPRTSIIEARFDTSDVEGDDERIDRQLAMIPQAWNVIKGLLRFRDAIESGDRQLLEQTFMPLGKSPTPDELDALLADFAALGLDNRAALHPAFGRLPWSPRAVRIAPAHALFCSEQYVLNYGDQSKTAWTVCWLQTSNGHDWAVTRVALHSDQNDWKFAVAQFDNDVIRQSDEGSVPETKAYYFGSNRLVWLTESVSQPGMTVQGKGPRGSIQFWMGLVGGTAEKAAEVLHDYYFFCDSGDPVLSDDGELPPRVRFRTVEHQVQTRISGTVKEVLVNDFDTVKAGTVLLTLENDEERIAVEEATLHLEMAKIELQRLEPLAKKGLAPQDELRAATNRVRLAELELERREVAFAKTRLVSPVDGTVRKRGSAMPGEFIQPGATIFGVVETHTIALPENLTKLPK